MDESAKIEELASVRASIITHEIESSLKSIHERKLILISFLKLYGTVVFAYFAYGAFLVTNFKNEFNSPPDDSRIILSVIGIISGLIIFSFGWALLGIVTKTIFGTIKQYKHISYMRNLSSMLFPENIFRENCINPIAAKRLPIRTSRYLPYLFTVINFLFLFSEFFFLRLIMPYDKAATWLLLPIGLLAIFYPRAATNHFLELRIVRLISPSLDENRIRDTYNRHKKANEKRKRFKLSIIILVLVSFLYASSFIFNFIDMYNQREMSQDVLLAQSISCILIAVFSFLTFYIKFVKIKFRINKRNKD